MSAYYNEFDPKAAAWLRELIKRGLITDGEVDDRSILDVEANDLRGFTRHHFFAGIGGWDYALQIANWPEDRPVCTASLPCQPFSSAGKQLGKADERHLLPHFLELVRGFGFRTIFGEQVPGAIKHGWLDDLCDEMERENYTTRAAVLTAAGAGAPHIRQRLYWVSDTDSFGCNLRLSTCEQETGQRSRIDCCDPINGVADTSIDTFGSQYRESGEGFRSQMQARGHCISSGMGKPDRDGCKPGSKTAETARYGHTIDATGWNDCEWLYCRDNKYRPVKPGVKPVVNWVPERMVRSGDSCESIDTDNTQEARVIRLKGYGNAIVPKVAAWFIKSFIKK